MTAGAVLAGTGALLVESAGALLLVAVALGAPWALLELSGVTAGLSETEVFRWGAFYDLAFGVVQSGAITLIAWRRISGEEAGTSDALRRGVRRWPSLAGASLQSGIITLVFLLLLVVPGVLRALSYAVVLPAVMIEGLAAGPSLRRSAQVMYGHRWTALFAIVPVALLALAPFACSALVPAVQASASLRALCALAESAAAVPLDVLAVVLFVKARRSHEELMARVRAGKACDPDGDPA